MTCRTTHHLACDCREEKVAELLAAAKAVVERWHTPLWKDAKPTAEYINAMRKAIEQLEPKEAK